MTDHRKAIEERIAYHREELSKLETALEVISGLEADQKPKAAPKAKPAQKAEAPAKQKTGKKASAAVQRNGLSPSDVRSKVEQALAEASGPLTSAEIAERLGMKDSRQPVYQALHTLKGSGKAVRDGEGRYTASAG